jgi:hypothetical protein
MEHSLLKDILIFNWPDNRTGEKREKQIILLKT